MYSLRHVLDVLRQTYPSVFACFVDRECWRRKGGFCECADRDGDTLLPTLDRVVHGCTADGTEIERDLAALIADPYVLLRLAFDLRTFSAEARLSTKDAARSTLAGETVTNRYPNWVFGGCCRELPTATGSGSCGHGGSGVDVFRRLTFAFSGAPSLRVRWKARLCGYLTLSTSLKRLKSYFVPACSRYPKYRLRA